MNYCIYIRKRKNKPFCKLLNKEITLSCCQECVNKKYKNAQKSKNIVHNITILNNIKPIIVKKSQKKKKYHNKKRITVSKEIYDMVIQRDKYCCRLNDDQCDGWLELHHILYRSERKDLINNIDNCIMLCTKHHKLVHSNKKYWQPILLKIFDKKKR